MDRFDRNHLLVIVWITSFLSLAFSGLEVVFTVFAVEFIQIDAAEWSRMRSLRLLLSVPIVFALALYSHRIRRTLIFVISVALTMLSCLLTVLFPTKIMLTITFPLFGGVSAVLLVNMNVIAQQAREALKSLSNTLYRTTFIGFSIVGPFVTGYLLDGGYWVAFLFFIVILFLSLLILPLYARNHRHVQIEMISDSTQNDTDSTLSQWVNIFRNRRILAFTVLSGLLNHAFMVNLVLMPIKLIDHLGVSYKHFSFIVTLNAISGLLFAMALGFFMKKNLHVIIVWLYLLCSIGNILMGVYSNILLLEISFILSTGIYLSTMAPTSIWLSQQAKDRLDTAFSFFKINSSLLGFFLTFLLSLFQPFIGIDNSLIIFGGAGVVLSVLLAILFRSVDKVRTFTVR